MQEEKDTIIVSRVERKEWGCVKRDREREKRLGNDFLRKVFGRL